MYGVDKKNTLGTEITIEINNIFHTKIHTSCSEPIGPGLVSGDFEVIYGESRNGGPLCPISKEEPPIIQFPKEIPPKLEDFIGLIILIVLIAIMLAILGILLSLHKFVVLDTDSFLFILEKKIHLVSFVKQAFGKNVIVAVTHSTVKELVKLSKSSNIKMRNRAAIALDVIKEFRIPVKGYIKLPKEKSYEKLGKKSNIYIIAHNKSLVSYLLEK